MPSPSHPWAILSTVLVGSIAVIATSIANGWVTKTLLRDPLLIQVLPEKKKVRPSQRVEDDGSGPELLKDAVQPADDLAATTGGKDSLQEQAPSSSPPRYSRQEQIWDDYEQAWINYVPAPPRREPDDDELLNWFKVYSRQKTASKDEKPSIVVEFISRTLINFLRSVLGSSETFRNRPIMSIHRLFPYQDQFNTWLQRLDSSTLQTLTLESQQDLAISVGVPNPKDESMDQTSLLKHLGNVVKQLDVLVTCLSKEFEPIQEELAVYLEHGHITYDLLGYAFKPGVKLLMYDQLTGDKIAVRMTNSSYQVSGNVSTFKISGTGAHWNGTKYASIKHQRYINEWEGTESLATLPWSILTAEDEQELMDRGRIYCQYSGIFHVFNKGPLGGTGRAIVDCLSQQDQSPTPEDDLEGAKAELPDEQLCYLPPTLDGFMLRTKSWKAMRVLDLAPVQFDRHAWDHLVLDPDTKLLIRSLVDVTRKGSAKSLVRDVITGKGGGLVSVLHGKPGTGKTLTAEAVAEHLERPIYVVGSEELPITASSLEKSLKTILNRVTRWDAVLLIDEADVFLEQRSMHELERNAAVSVALRLLEYHSGVLFLTTNRIKSFDEAFLSRFSIGIKYPDLDQASRLKIWLSFLRMAEVEIVDDKSDLPVSSGNGKSRMCVEDLEKLAEKSFNGRSIKNLVRTSQALALAHNQPLAIEHLRIVARTSERFIRDFEEIEGPGA